MCNILTLWADISNVFIIYLLITDFTFESSFICWIITFMPSWTFDIIIYILCYFLKIWYLWLWIYNKLVNLLFLVLWNIHTLFMRNIFALCANISTILTFSILITYFTFKFSWIFTIWIFICLSGQITFMSCWTPDLISDNHYLNGFCLGVLN